MLGIPAAVRVVLLDQGAIASLNRGVIDGVRKPKHREGLLAAFTVPQAPPEGAE